MKNDNLPVLDMNNSRRFEITVTACVYCSVARERAYFSLSFSERINMQMPRLTTDPVACGWTKFSDDKRLDPYGHDAWCCPECTEYLQKEVTDDG